MFDSGEPAFDLEKAEKTVRVYSQSTGVGCSVIDSRGICIFSSGGDSGLCEICAKTRSSAGRQAACGGVHLYGSYQAERFGGKYVFFCPIGLVHWASPITAGNELRGALIGGPVQMMAPEDFLLEDLIKKSGIDDRQLAELRQYVERIPVIQTATVDNLSELLFIVASTLSDGASSRYYETRSSMGIQAEIFGSLHDIKNTGESGPGKDAYPFEKEKELLSRIANGDRPESQRILNEILGYVFFSSGRDFNIIKSRVLELVVLLSRAAMEGGADSSEIFGLNDNYINEINSLKTVEDLTYWLSKIMARFTDCVFDLADIRHKDTIFKAFDYIKKNYMLPITLEDVARHVYLNPSYFSRVFRNEMKCTFVSYVNKIRINASKSLLADTSLPLTDISSMVGFEDQSYFTKVFKKITGVTPGRFRELRGQ
jgi:two-component system response regulator YesN